MPVQPSTNYVQIAIAQLKAAGLDIAARGPAHIENANATPVVKQQASCTSATATEGTAGLPSTNPMVASIQNEIRADQSRELELKQIRIAQLNPSSSTVPPPVN